MPCVGQDFTTYEFAATGSSAKRTLPNRLSDIINVQDWGALGIVGNNYTTQIQAAIDYCINNGGGKVFFPPGTYQVGNLEIGTSDASKQNNTIQIVGAAVGAAHVVPAGSGWTLSKGARTYDLLHSVECMEVSALQTLGAGNNGAIKVTRSGCYIFNVFSYGWFAIDATQAPNCYISNCSAIGTTRGTASDANHGFIASGATGYQVTDGGLIEGTHVSGYDIGFAFSGIGSQGTNIFGEVNNTIVRVGWANGAETPAYGCVISPVLGEQNDIGVDLYNCTGGYVSSGHLFCSNGTGIPMAAAIDSVTWGGGTATVTTHDDHNLINSPYCVFLTGGDAAWYPYAGSLMVKVTSTGAKTFTYSVSAPSAGTFAGTISSMSWDGGSHVVTVTIPLISAPIANGSLITMSGPDASWGGPTVVVTGGDTTHFTYAGPGSAPGGTQTGTWTYKTPTSWGYPGSYSLRCRKVYETVINGIVRTDTMGKASYDLDYADDTGTGGPVEFRNNVFMNSHATMGWSLPTDKKQLAGWKFINCTGVALPQSFLSSNVASPDNQMVFTDLPGNGQLQPLLAGQQYNITDGDAAGFGAVQAGGGGGKYLVRYDGTNWIRIG